MPFTEFHFPGLNLFLGVMLWLYTTTPRRGSHGCSHMIIDSRRTIIVGIIYLVTPHFYRRNIHLPTLSVNDQLREAR